MSGTLICRLAEEASTAGIPAEALRIVKQLRTEIDDFERQQVARALTAGEPVSAVARALGVSRQSAHRRFRDLVPPRMHATRTQPTPEARLVVEYARREARDMSAAAIASEHLLLGILRSGDHDVAKGLHDLGVTLEAARRSAREIVSTRDVKVALARAVRYARGNGARQVGVEHILVGALEDPDSGAARLLQSLGVAPEDAREIVEPSCRLSAA
ncbi:MAG TPA: Clp protease N-terminal domain-containing protein [Solirubrobacter sp.]|nr:Clp protease N-terminal domain-containing protein [Solirubrobacter sp.]